MNSKKFLAFFALFLLCFSVNVFADYEFKLLNAEVMTSPGGSSWTGTPENAYYDLGSSGTGEYPSHKVLTDNDWIELEITLENISTNDSGTPLDLIDFSINLYGWGIFSSYPLEVSWAATGGSIYSSRTGSLNSCSGGSFNPACQITFNIPIEINAVDNIAGFYEVREISVIPAFPGGNFQVPQWLNDLSNPLGDNPNVEIYDPDWVLAAPPVNSLDVFLDPINCIDTNPATNPTLCTDLGNPVCTATGSGLGPGESPFHSDPIRCDLVDSNTISYEIMIRDTNVLHDPLTGSTERAVVTYVQLDCLTSPPNRINHFPGGCPLGLGCYLVWEGFWYEGFPPSCEFLHYNESTGMQPMHTDCSTYWDVYPEYSTPPLFTAIPDCTVPFSPGCPEQDKNIFYNTNRPLTRKYLGDSNPAVDFSLQWGDEKIFKGTLTNASTGGNIRCTARVEYYLYDGATQISGPYYTASINTGSNNRSYDGTDMYDWYAKVLKLKGHDAFVVTTGKFMPSSLYIRPEMDWTVELPIANSGNPWDGATSKDILYADINIFDDSYTDVGSTTLVLDGRDLTPGDEYYKLDTDEEKLFIVHFPITHGVYHQFLDAVAMNAKLYDEDGWIFDLTKDTSVNNVRLITILSPVMYEWLGDACFTDPNLDGLCWWNKLVRNMEAVDLNANTDINFILRLRNPFDFNEHFALSYETSDPGNARLDFEPEINFVPPFTSGTYGYKYAKMILRNPRILRGDANYTIIDTSVDYPYVWDSVFAELRTFSDNLKILSFDLNYSDRTCYNIEEDINFNLIIKNESDRDLYDVNFLVVSSTDPSVLFYAGNGISIGKGATQEIIGTIPAIPGNGVYVVKALVEPREFEIDLSDNTASVYFSTCYQGDVSKLPETNHVFILLVLFVVLFMVIKK